MDKVFLSYSHQDSRHHDAFGQAVERLEAAGLIDLWHDEQVAPGAPGPRRSAEICVVRQEDVRDEFSYPEVRLHYDGVLIERDEHTVFRCDAARLAAERVLGVGGPVP